MKKIHYKFLGRIKDKRMSIIKSAHDSRKLSEKNDPYGTNLNTILEMVEFRINEACKSGVYFASVNVNNSIRDDVILALISQGYKVETRRAIMDAKLELI